MSEPATPREPHHSDPPPPQQQGAEPTGAPDHEPPVETQGPAVPPRQEPDLSPEGEREPTTGDAPWLTDAERVDATEEFDLPVTGAPRPQPRPRRRWPGAIRAFLFLTTAFVLSGLAQVLVGLFLLRAVFVNGLPDDDPQSILRLLEEPQVLFSLGLSSLLPTLFVTWAFTVGWERRPLAAVGLQVDRAAVRQFAAGVALGAVLIGFIFVVEAALGWVRITRVASAPQLVAHAAFWLVVLLPMAAWEEVLLRGYSFQALVEQWGDVAAIVITSLLFGFFHVANPGSGWPAIWGITAAGILFGVAVVVTGRLWLPIGLHASWNLFEGPVFGFPVSGMELPGAITTTVTGPELWTGGSFGPEAGLISLLASLLGIVILLAARRRVRTA